MRIKFIACVQHTIMATPARHSGNPSTNVDSLFSRPILFIGCFDQMSTKLKGHFASLVDRGLDTSVTGAMMECGSSTGIPNCQIL